MVMEAGMSDIDRYEDILNALCAKPYHGVRSDNLRLPRDPKRALADIQAVQLDMIERELQR